MNYRGYACGLGLFLMLPCGVWAGAFDSIPIGARAQGMGGAYTAVAEDPSATYWNPAGLGGVRRSSFNYSHLDIQTLGLLSYDFFSYAQPFVLNNTVAISWTRLATTANVTFLNYAENTFTLSWQQPIVPEFSLGLNLKIFQVDYEKTAGGVGGDLGGRYQITPNVAAAFMVENFNSPEIHWVTGAMDRLPLNARVGIAGYLLPELTLSLDVDRLLEKNIQTHIGAEYWLFSRMLALRAGGTHWSAEGKFLPSAGLGIRVSFLEFCYAYTQHYDFDGNHVLSLQWGF